MENGKKRIPVVGRRAGEEELPVADRRAAEEEVEEVVQGEVEQGKVADGRKQSDHRKLLDKVFSAQNYAAHSHDRSSLQQLSESYRVLAQGYAQVENAIAVLSDLKSRKSDVYYGGFSRMLRLGDCGKDTRLSTIWEEEIFRIVHPDDLQSKMLQELRFYQYVKQLPSGQCSRFYLAACLRMRSRTDAYLHALHRLYYIPLPGCDALWMALCLYTPLPASFPEGCFIVDSVTGQTTPLEAGASGMALLSDRERQVLVLIDRGLTSKQIAAQLSISQHTVSRHRQEILAKLRVRNSIEACRIAKQLKLL